MSIRFIYFDLGNVLLNFSQELACLQIAKLSQISPDTVQRVIFDEGLQDRFERGEVTTDEFYQAYCDATKSSPTLDDLRNAVSEIFELNVPIVPVVAHLRAAGYPLGILSNTCEPHWIYCSSGRYRVISALFERAILSYEVGAMKPEAAIFHAAIDAAGVAAEEIFFTDDRAEHVAGARQCGIDAVVYESPRALIAELAKRKVRFNL